MNTKTTWILLLLVLLLGGYIAFVEKHLGSTIERRARARLAFRINPEEVSYLRMERNTMRMECVKQGKDWLLQYPEGMRAQSALISKVLSRLSRLERGEIITEKDMRERQLNLSHYGLDRPEARISLGNEFAQRTLLIGRTAPLGDSLYIKDQALPDVLAVTVDLLDIIPASLDDLRERKVLPVQIEHLGKLEIQRPQGFLRIERTAGGPWLISQPTPGGGDQAAITDWLTKLAALRIEKFISDEPADDSSYGFGDESIHLKWWSSDQKDPVKLMLGGEVPDETGLVYARLEHIESVFALPAGFLQLLKLDVNVLRDRALLPFPADRITSTTLAADDREILFKREAGSWIMAEPASWKVEPALMESLLKAWDQAQVLRFLDPGEVKALANTNRLMVSVVFTHVSDKEGGLAGDPAAQDTGKASYNFYAFDDESNRLMVHMQHMNIWAETSRDVLRLISLDPMDYRHREVMSLEAEDVIRISREGPGNSVSISRKGPEDLWKPAEEDILVEPARVDALLNACRSLRVRKYVAQDPSELSRYGLEAPVIRLSFGLSGKTGIGKTLLLGQSVEDEGIYAMVLGQDLVFLLDIGTRDMLTQEWWTTVDSRSEKDREPESPSRP